MLSLVYVDSQSDPETSVALSYSVRMKASDDRTVALAVGGEDMRPILSSFLRFGADEAYLVTGDDVIGGDVFTHARIIRAFLDTVDEDYLVLFDRNFILPSVLSGMLDSQQFLYVRTMTFDDGTQCISDYGTEERRCGVPPGSVLSFLPGKIANERVPGNGEIKVFDRVALNLGRFSVGEAGSKIERR